MTSPTTKPCKFSLTNNSELAAFLVKLGDELGSAGEADLSEAVAIAGKFVNGSPSEFLHEAHLSLRKVQKESGSLTEQQRAEIAFAISAIEKAFGSVGGA